MNLIEEGMFWAIGDDIHYPVGKEDPNMHASNFNRPRQAVNHFFPQNDIENDGKVYSSFVFRWNTSPQRFAEDGRLCEDTPDGMKDAIKNANEFYTTNDDGALYSPYRVGDVVGFRIQHRGTSEISDVLLRIKDVCIQDTVSTEFAIFEPVTPEDGQIFIYSESDVDKAAYYNALKIIGHSKANPKDEPKPSVEGLVRMRMLA
ncbi:MAG: hypothetical protein CME70_06020 [Halobacteriovorax sp.]|nr:hypothetical protein [Halobacteriovorax sp.]